MRLGRLGVRVANAITILALQLGVPRPPYTRRNALIVETIGRRSGRRRQVPVGYLEAGSTLLVVVEDGARADWVRNAVRRDGRLRIHHLGNWRDARLRLVEGDVDDYLERMSTVHASLVRAHSTSPAIVEITPDR